MLVTRRPSHQGTVIVAGRLAWRSTGVQVRRFRWMVTWSPWLVMILPVGRNRRWRGGEPSAGSRP